MKSLLLPAWSAHYREPWLRSDSSESGTSVTHSVGSEEHGKCNLPVSQLVQSIKTGKFNLSKNLHVTRVCGDSM